MEPQSDQEGNTSKLATITDDKLRSGGFAFTGTDGAALMFNFAPNSELAGKSIFADTIAPTVTTKNDEAAIESTFNVVNATEFSFDWEQYRSTKNIEQTMVGEGVGISHLDLNSCASPIFSMAAYAASDNLSSTGALSLPLGTAGGSRNISPDCVYTNRSILTGKVVVSNSLSPRPIEEQGSIDLISCASEAETISDNTDGKDFSLNAVPRANTRPIAKLSARKARKFHDVHDSNTLDATVFASLVQQMKLKFEKDTQPPLIDMDKRTALDHIKRLEDKISQLERQAHSTNRDDINLNHENKKLNMLKERDTSSDETNRGMDISWDVVRVKFKKELDEHVTEELKRKMKESLPPYLSSNKKAFGEDRGLDSNIMADVSVSNDGTVNHKPKEAIDVADTETSDSELERDIISAMKAAAEMDERTSISSTAEEKLGRDNELVKLKSEMEHLERKYNEIKGERESESMEAQRTLVTHQETIQSLKEEKEHCEKLSEVIAKLETNIEELKTVTTKQSQQITVLECTISRAKESMENAAQKLGFSYADDHDLTAYICEFIDELLDLYHKSSMVGPGQETSQKTEETRRLAEEAAEIMQKVSGSLIKDQIEKHSLDKRVATLTQYFEASEEYCRELYAENARLLWRPQN